MSTPIINEDITTSGMYIQYKEDYPHLSTTILKSMAYDYYDMQNAFISKEQYYREVSRHDLLIDEPELSGEELEQKVEDWTYESMYFYKRAAEETLDNLDNIRENGGARGLTDEEIEAKVAEEKRRIRWLS